MAYLKYMLLVVTLTGVYCNDTKVDYMSVFDVDLYESVLDSELCEAQLTFLSNNSLNFRFIDTSGKLPNGVQGGNFNDLGNYFECLEINEILDELHFEGKYCTILVPLDQNPISIPQLPDLPDIPGLPDLPDLPFPPPSNDTTNMYKYYQRVQSYVRGISGAGEPVENRILPITYMAQSLGLLGVCVPKVCTATQAVNFFQSITPFFNYTFDEYYCRLPNDKPFATADYVAIAIFSFIGLLLLLSTSYDLYNTFILKNGSRVNPLFASFSVYTNTRRLLNFKPVPGALECVDGIRSISMMWVIVGHTYGMSLLGFIHNLFEALNWLQSMQATWINSAPITVDTFFLLSGILAVYSVVGKLNLSRFIKTIHLFYLNRLLRMFPLLAAVVLLQASLFNHVSDGPYWVNTAKAVHDCRTNWWTTLLHVQNYVNPLNICLVQTWYLSVDTQLYIVCPLVLVFLFGRERFAWPALTAFVLLSLVGSTLYSFLNDFSAALANFNRLAQLSDYIQLYYMNTLARAPPFFVGLIYGYLLYLCKDKKIRISKLNVAILWIMSFTMMAFCIASIYPVMQSDHEAQLLDNFLNAYMRAIWAVGLGWLIFACVHGYGGPINWFLSLQMWKLPARLSFAMYLLHIPIIYTVTGSWTNTYYFTEGNNIYRFLADLSLTFIFSFVLCVTIDAPFSTIQKLLLGGGKRPSKPVEESPVTTQITHDHVKDDEHFVKTTL